MSSRRAEDKRLPLLVVALTAAAFAAALRCGFVWDDWEFLLRGYGYRGLDPGRLRWMLTTLYFSNWCPLTWLSWALDYKVWGLEPLGYHLTNVALHCANAWLFYELSKRLLSLWNGARLSARAVAGGAAAAALLFALHPLRVESVAWVSERRDVLSGVFFLASLLLYLRRETALSFGAYVLACMSKASVVPLPAVLVILDVFVLRRKDLKKAALEKLAFAVPAAGTAALAVLAARGPLGGGAAPVPYPEAAARAVYSLGFYAWKTVWPSGLFAFYPAPAALTPFSLRIAGIALALAAAVLFLRAAGLAWRAQAALWSYYVVMLAPVLGVVRNGFSLVADRYSYLPCLGWALLAGALAAEVFERHGGESAARWRTRDVAAAAALGAAALGFTLVTQRRLARWTDQVTLWSEIVERSPQSQLAWLNLSAGLLDHGRAPEAERVGRVALELRPRDTIALLVVAQALDLQGRAAQASALLRACADHPRDFEHTDDQLAEIQLALGELLRRERKPDEAERRLRSAVALAPGSARAHAALARLLVDTSRAVEARDHLLVALELDPAAPREDVTVFGTRIDRPPRKMP